MARTPGKIMHTFGRLAKIPPLPPARGAPKMRITRSEELSTGGAVVSTETVFEPVKNRWNSLGEFLQAVARSGSDGGKTDPRLVRAPSGLNETDPTAGGFAAPSQFESELIGSMYEEDDLLWRCDRRETDKISDWKLPAIDEISRADGSRQGGALAYWTGEAVQPSGSIPKYKQVTYSSHRLIALSTVTNELLDDVKLLDTHVRRVFAAEASFKLSLAVLRGTGAGLPLGITFAPCTIQVAKAVGQAAGTIVAQNITDMWSRLPAPCRKRAVWIVNEDAEAQLDLITASGGLASTNGMYFPAGTGGNEFALVKGRPVIVAEQCPTLGTPGDIILADLSQYIIIEAGVQAAVSMDVSYLSDESIFRFRWRGDGKPAWASAITPFNGGATRSPFVTLAQR
jgi:HK97 family phage major capsid protein